MLNVRIRLMNVNTKSVISAFHCCQHHEMWEIWTESWSESLSITLLIC